MNRFKTTLLYREKQNNDTKKCIMVVAAHPDDEVLGAGGAMALLARSGHRVCTLILGEGKTSRGDEVETLEIDELRREMEAANRLLGVSECYFADLPDNRFDSVALLDVVRLIEQLKEEIRPETVLTHHFGDMNVDHQVTYRAVLTATRPMEDECVKDIYTFEIPSSTEWNAFSRDTVFVPNVFLDITSTIDLKVAAMEKYVSELREYPHPRSLRHIKELAKVAATKVGLEYGENFALVRSIRKEF